MGRKFRKEKLEMQHNSIELEMQHNFTEPYQIKYPGGKDGSWRVACSCDEYLTVFCGTARMALYDLANHIEGKTGNRPKVPNLIMVQSSQMSTK